MLGRPPNKLVFTHPSFDIGCFSHVRHVSGVIQTTFFTNLVLINSDLIWSGGWGDVSHMSALYRAGPNLQLT